MKYYVGVDIGGTRCKLGIIDEFGKVYVHENEETKTKKEDLMAQVLHFVQRNERAYDIAGVGISVPGVVTKDGYMLSSGAVKCFLKQPIKQDFESLLSYPVHIENDSKSAAAAEKWIGAARNLSDFVCITLGTAVGGAIYIHGALHRGLGGLAGDFGVSLMGSERGHYSEQSASCHAGVVAGLCRNYSLAVKERVLDAKEIYRRSKQGDEIAQSCIEHFYHDVAILIVNITVSIAPQQILIGGGISSNEEAMQGIKQAYETIQQEYHVLSLVEMPELLTCALKNDAGMIGAVYPFVTKI